MGSCPLQQRRMIGHFIVDFSAQKGFELVVAIPLGGFEPPSPDPKSCMIDRYTTGVFDTAIMKFECRLFFKESIICMLFRTIRIPLSSTN